MVTTPLARDEPQVLATASLGAAWLAIAGKILAEGIGSRYDDRPVRELSLVTLVVSGPDPDDEIIARYAETERLAWMRANFVDHHRGVRRSAARTATPPGCSTTTTPAGISSPGSSTGSGTTRPAGRRRSPHSSH